MGKKVDKEAVLAEYNKRKEKKERSEFYEKRERQYQEYISSCTEKYLQNEDFWEFEALQIFLSNNPFKEAYNYLRPFDSIEEGDSCVLVGIIAKIQKKKTKTGSQMAFVNVYSSNGLIEAIVWSSQLKEFEDLIKKGTQIAMKCKKESETQVVCDSIKDYKAWLKYAERKLNK